MIWPVAALAVLLFAFVLAYGTVMQARVEAGVGAQNADPPVEL